MDLEDKGRTASYDNPALEPDDGFVLHPIQLSDNGDTEQYSGGACAGNGSETDTEAPSVVNGISATANNVQAGADNAGKADVRRRDVRAVQLLSVRALSEPPAPQPEVYNPESLDTFVRRKQGIGIKQLAAKKLRTFYKKQDKLIVSYEDLSREDSRFEEEGGTDVGQKRRRLASIFAKVTLGINTGLMIAKLVASILSGSMSIISSLVDSVVDLMSGLILWWASRAIKRRDPYAYPQGRTKLEPVSIIILSVVMGMASLQLIRESAQIMGSLAVNDTELPSMTVVTFVIAGSTIVIKFILWFVCRRVDSPIVQALAMDHRNDVMSNTVAIVCGWLGSSEFQAQFGIRAFVFADPVGAILISMYIIFNWWRIGKEQLKTLTGHTADPEFISKVTWVAMNHDPNITHIDTVRAYHYGNNFIVKVDIVLPETMPLREAHDIGESLQQKIERMPDVERAFVHVDYEYQHKPSSEHKTV